MDSINLMFDGKRLLMESYQEIESFPDWPLDLNIRENQKVLRDFMSRFTTELAEAFERLVLQWGFVNTNQLKNAQECCEYFNEEIADAWQFLLEIMVFSGICEDELRQWMASYKTDNAGFEGMMDETNVLGSLLKFANWKNRNEGKTGIYDERNLFVVYKMEELIAKDKMECQGARRISTEMVDGAAEYQWWITYTIHIAMNRLKIKDWTREERKSNTLAYLEGIIDTFILMIQYMDFLGKDESSILKSFTLNTKKNFDRIKNGY